MDSVNNDFRIGTLKNQAETREVKDNSVLDQDDFLKIIAANISNPSLPGSDSGSGSETDFMGQMIQMNLLEQVTDLTESIQSTMLMTHQQQALSLVGKKVTVRDTSSDTDSDSEDDKVKNISGIVEKIRFKPDGMSTIEIDGEEYSLQNVTEVSEPGQNTNSGEEKDPDANG